MNLPVILRVFKGEHVVEVKQFQLDQIVIGNQAEVNLQLNDPSVSPIHALIEKRNETYYICDLGSTQGTFKDSNQVLDDVLESGDELKIGNFRIQFNVGAPKPRTAAPDAVATPIMYAGAPPVPTPAAHTTTSHPSYVSVAPSSVNTHNVEPVMAPVAPATPVYSAPVTPTSVEATPVTAPVTPMTPVAPSAAVLSASTSTSTLNDEEIKKSEEKTIIASPILSSTPAPVSNPVGASAVNDRPNLENGISVNKSQQHIEPSHIKPMNMPSHRPDLSTKTFAPPSVISELNQVVKASRGSVLEVSVAWKERIIETYHFRGNKTITIGSHEKADISIPGKVFPGTFILAEFQGGVATINLSQSMVGDLILEKKSYHYADLKEIKRITTGVKGQDVIRLEQGEAFRLALVPDTINIYIRYVPSTQKPSLVPFFPFTTGEIASVLLATALVGLIALYNLIHAPIEIPKEEIEPEIISVTKFVYPKVQPAPEKSVTPPPTPPPVKVETPPKEKQKLVLGDQNRAATTKSETPLQKPGKAVTSGGAAGSRAAEAAPNKNPTAKKAFTSIQQGGSVKLGAQAGANASQTKKPVDLSNVGLTSTFGGGGVNSKLRQAVQGAGGIIGDANQATGAAGFSKGRPGDDLGSAFKDTGAGGKGVALEGINGGITNGRGSGNSGYGGVGSGLGDKSGVSVDVGGYGATFAGTIDRNAVLRVIQNHKSVIRRCYERELRFKTTLSGRLVIKFEIGEKGKVLSAKVDESSLNNKGVETCLTNELITWQFPEPPANSVAEVLFPFNFQNEE